MKRNRKKLLAIYLIGCISFFSSCKSKNHGEVNYLDPNLPVDQRVENLLSQMTLEEKIAQMCQYVGPEHIREAEMVMSEKDLHDNDAMGYYPGLSVEKLEEMTRNGMVGSFLHVKTPEEANHLQQLARKSRLRIPVLIGIDAIHGNALNVGATVYPTPIGMASTWEPALVERSARETALEMRAMGAQWAFTPNIDIARDARWGRVGETFGEDPHLVSKFGVAMIRGMQGDNFTGEDKVIACAKHLIAGSEPVNGLNAAPMDVSERTLREIFLPPYQAAIDVNVFSMMAAHNELNGVPCHSNHHIMTELMRNEMGFNGFFVSDWMDIERLVDQHFVAETEKEACYLSVDAGMDMHMHGPRFHQPVKELVEEGRLSEERINQSVRKLLEAKFRLGLFENPYVDIAKGKEQIFANEHQQTALDMARKSIVMLKNEGVLPIDTKKYRKILVTGPNANNQTIMGDWSAEQPEDNVATIFEGIQQEAPARCKVNFYDCSETLLALEDAKIKKAASLARNHDLTIVVVGENSMRYKWDDKTCGENTDRSNIQLPGKQQQLVEALYMSGKPVIVVLVNGRPLGIEWIADHSPALIEAWEPGSFGGQALAEILFGKINPSAKLPISVPRNVGQIQTVYNHKPSQYFHKYKSDKTSALFHFGYGLSYTEFKYDNLTLSKKQIHKNDSLLLTVQVRNVGKRRGDEIVQLYIRDEFSSVTRPVKELKAFKKVDLDANESAVLQFVISPKMLEFYDIDMNRKVEAGSFKVMVGGSSLDEDLLHVKFEVIE
ncbi:glycoside hydrolase family 3 N-terminal domain-containing protein [Marinifilum fragile]|uniref:glycoside hydrolase family 3 N-terminal domain-containing protein n=1 Tax=Marinifilum fragile TaxID=570161 RepID=UPI002AA7BAEC|nr:glycoside hydrolase family 3 N-terminal domain-containing protein [Marinifilum fragile]